MGHALDRTYLQMSSKKDYLNDVCSIVHANFQKNEYPTKIETKVRRGTLLLFGCKVCQLKLA